MDLNVSGMAAFIVALAVNSGTVLSQFFDPVHDGGVVALLAQQTKTSVRPSLTGNIRPANVGRATPPSQKKKTENTTRLWVSEEPKRCTTRRWKQHFKQLDRLVPTSH